MNKYLIKMRDGKPLSLTEQMIMIIQLSIPAIIAQISNIIMQYIDASMVGSLGPNPSAAIGLVSSSTWLMGGICSAVATGFTVQVAHKIGASDEKGARNIVKTGLLLSAAFSFIICIIGMSISQVLPIWLRGDKSIIKDATEYFFIYSAFIAVLQLNSVSAGMLQCSGNMKVPGMLQAIMCGLDVILNWIFIFKTRVIKIMGLSIVIPGAGLGIKGAAIATGLAQLIIVSIMIYFLLVKSESLHIRKNEKLRIKGEDIKKAIKISVPMGIEQIITCSAYIAFTAIVSPLGKIALAANSFAITAESLCYMPGYGIGHAATTIIGQSLGANRKDLAKRLGWLSTFCGVAVMTLTGALMYFAAPWMIGLLTPDENIRELGTQILRIEAFAEPFYAASIVATGVFRGAGDTVVPSVTNFISMWLIRIPLAAILGSRMGLKGVWIAMCVELCARGTLFLIRLWQKFNIRKDKKEQT